MPGTLVITTLSDGTNSTSATNPIQGSAKAWVNWDGLTGGGNTIRTFYNVSSITNSGSGVYVINFTNAFPNANYVVAGMAQQGGVANGIVMGFAATAPTTSALQVNLCNAPGNGSASVTRNTLAVFSS
jgi:hypothetical protein